MSQFDDFLNDDWRKGWKEGWQEGWAEGWREGQKEEAADIARRMIANGSIPLPQIAEFSGLSLGEVETIRRSISDGDGRICVSLVV